jgi:general secretion pathway protein J
MRCASASSAATRGFSLIEAVVTMLLMAIMLSTLGSITSHWLPLWHKSFARTERDQIFANGLDRLIADLGAAQFIPIGRNAKAPLFIGTRSGLIFVRRAIGPNAPRGLDIVRISELEGPRGRDLVRARIEFAPSVSDEMRFDEMEFRDPVVVLRSSYRASFSYADDQGAWTESWRNATKPPSAVEISVRDVTSGALVLSSVATIRVDSPATIVCKASCENPTAVSWDGGRLQEQQTGAKQ